MLDYIICGLFFIVFTIGIYIFGSFLSDENSSWSTRFVKGYFIYSFFVAIFGIIVQVFNLSWIVFEAYMIILILFISLYCIYEHLKKGKKIKKINSFFKNNWFLIIITLFLMFLTCFHYTGYWFNNHLDDGYYINKIAMYPYVNNPLNIIPATGFLKQGIDSYVLNTFEIEASFFVYILRVTPTLYCRFFLAGFNYFLLVNVICVFNEKIVKLLKYEYKEQFIQYTTLIVLFFAFDERFLNLKNISIIKDSNQFCNAMYYGSSIVRTMGIMILLYPLIGNNKINMKLILEYFVISVVLISKSSVALPIILGIVITYLIVCLFKGRENKKRYLVSLVTGTMLANFVFYRGQTVEISNAATNVFIRNIKLIGVFPVFVLFIAMYILFIKNKKMTDFNNMIIIFFIITTVPLVNSFISKFSFYKFVVERTFTCFYYTLIIIVFLYICILMLKNKKEIIYKTFIITVMCFLTLGDLYTLKKAGGSILEGTPMTELNLGYALKVIRYENKFIPNSILKLGEILNELSKKNSGDLNVLSREYHTINGKTYTIAASLTSVSPNIKSISAKFRYGGEVKSNPFHSFSIDDQNNFEQFMFNFNKKVYSDFKNTINKYPINCIILTVKDKDEYMKEMGYSLYKIVADDFENVEYYIYIK